MAMAATWKDASWRSRLESLRLSRRLQSAFAILVYLTAALPPCEDSERLQMASVELHAVTHSPRVEIERSASQTNTAREEHDPDHSKHDHSKHDHLKHGHAEEGASDRHPVAFAPSVAHASSRHHSSGHDSNAADEPGRPATAQTRAADASTAHLVFTAPCVCGCGDTRATVGGGASRLGAVVPGQFVTQLLSPPAESAVGANPGRFVREILEIDPIPI